MFSFPVAATSLLLTLALGQAQAADPFAVTTLRPDRGPEVLVHRQAGPLVALRMSVPVDRSVPVGAPELLHELARPEAREAADALGARLVLRHAPGRAVVSLTGPATGFDALVTILRRMAGEPELSAASLRQAQARAEDRVLARLEQPEPRIRSGLWRRLNGATDEAAEPGARLDPEAVRALIRRLYRADRLRITVVGPIPDELVRSAFQRWPVPPADPDGTPEGPAEVAAVGEGSELSGAAEPDVGWEAPRPQAHREWVGLGYRTEAKPAVLAVAAELVRARLERSALRSGTAQAWHGPAGWSLVVTGAAEPGDSVVRAVARTGALPVAGASPDEEATGVGRYLRRMVAEAAALSGPGSVAAARTRLRRSLLVEARTPTGRAELIGSLADALGPEGAAAFVAALSSVELDEVRRLLLEVLETPAIYVDAS